MKSMLTMRLQVSSPAPDLTAAEIPIPVPLSDEVLIRVHAAGVTPTELAWYPTTHRKDGSLRVGAIPGHEFSGVIEALGPDARGWEIGTPVFGLNDWFADGATAEFCVAKASALAPKPVKLTHAEAATVPIGALTAWQGLVDRAKLQTGEHVLIHGGAGAVGVFAVQLAKRLGARVSTTASARHAEFLRKLGADEIIDYRAGDFTARGAAYDVVLDAVGGSTLQRSWSVLKPGGRLVTIAADAEGQTDPRVKAAFFIVEPNGSQLAEIARLLQKGELSTFLDGSVPLREAAAAYAGTARREHHAGKLVIQVIPEVS